MNNMDPELASMMELDERVEIVLRKRGVITSPEGDLTQNDCDLINDLSLLIGDEEEVFIWQSGFEAGVKATETQVIHRATTAMRKGTERVLNDEAKKQITLAKLTRKQCNSFFKEFEENDNEA